MTYSKVMSVPSISKKGVKSATQSSEDCFRAAGAQCVKSADVCTTCVILGVFSSRAPWPVPSECSANATDACQYGHHCQLLVPSVKGTSICNMAPSLLADEVTDANFTFVPNVPKNVFDTTLLLKLLHLKEWPMGAEPGPRKSARS